MTSKKRDLSIPWPFAPSSSAMNRDTGLLKLIAMLAMVCDHAGVVLFPQYRILRVIGRLAFPIYAYCLALGCVYTQNPLRYLRRLVLLALISQPLHEALFNHTQIQFTLDFYMKGWRDPSILVSLVLGMLVIWSIRERELLFTAALAILIAMIQIKLDYKAKGIILMVLFYLFIQKRWLSLPCMLAYMVWWGLQGNGYSLFGVRFGIQMFAVLALPLIYIRTRTGIRLPKWLFYAFYPAHLLVLLLLKTCVF